MGTPAHTGHLRVPRNDSREQQRTHLREEGADQGASPSLCSPDLTSFHYAVTTLDSLKTMHSYPSDWIIWGGGVTEESTCLCVAQGNLATHDGTQAMWGPGHRAAVAGSTRFQEKP